MMQAKKDTIKWVPIILEDAAGADIINVAYNDAALSIWYIKEGGDWAQKVLASGDWDFCADVVSNGARVFKIKFSAAELDTLGNFNFSVYYTGALTYDGYMEVVEYTNEETAGLILALNDFDPATEKVSLNNTTQTQIDDIQEAVETDIPADIAQINLKNFTGIPL